MSNNTNLDRTLLQQPEVEAPAHAGDVFDKALSFTRADEAMAAGVYPYFKPISEHNGGTVVVDGREMIITGSNDYLGLTQDPRLAAAAEEVSGGYGTSCTGSRFLTGTLTLHEELERRLADFLGVEAVLTFSTGYLGSLSVLSALVGRQDILYFDRENHASLYDGARLSYGTLRRYRHGDLEGLRRLLAADTGRPGGRMIVTDGVFSMSGYVADLPGIVGLAREYGARVVVDDAHAVGVLGDHGRGTAEHFGLEDDIDMIIGTFSKSFASVGGFVSGPRAVVDYVKHHARPFIFTAAPSAMQVAVTLEALRIMESESRHRERVLKNAAHLRRGMAELGFDTLGSRSQIVPVLIGPDELTMVFWKALWDAGIFTTPALPPGVPTNASLIRTSVNANHTPEQIEVILRVFAEVGRRLGVVG